MGQHVHATFDNQATPGTPEAPLQVQFAGGCDADPLFYVVLGIGEHIGSSSRLFMGSNMPKMILQRVLTVYERLDPAGLWIDHRLTPRPTGRRRIVRDTVATRIRFRSGDSENAYFRERRYVDPQKSADFYWMHSDYPQSGVRLQPSSGDDQVVIRWGGSCRLLYVTRSSQAPQG